MSILADYLAEVRATINTGANTPETSFYPAIKAMLDAIGAELKPKVRCIMNLRDHGAGFPDGGLFTADQFGSKLNVDTAAQVFLTLKPGRGAIEVKPPSDDLGALSATDQISRYGKAYRHVLITNLREFALLEQSVDGTPKVKERFKLADSAVEFWVKAARPQVTAGAIGKRFEDFLRRVLLTPAPLATPEELARFLASYARDALAQIEHAKVPGLTDISDHLEAALGVGFQGVKGKHFFNSTLVQTLFYGAFSAWVLWCRTNPRPDQRFSWKDTGTLLHLTMLRVLFHEVTRPTSFFSLCLLDGLGLAEDALNRVDRTVFFQRFREHEAVQYFYEPFLEAFDPELRKELGVWYTPDEVVRFMVEQCDQSLRHDLGIKAGFADPSVQVLDPCCGTGAFLVAVLDRIRRTLEEDGEGSLAPALVARAVRERVLGFEILPAPYVISHLQVALYLQSLGTRLGDDERAAIYLTNALTGWGKKRDKKPKLLLELAEERDAADNVKRREKVLVIIGNPPYNAFAGVQPEEEQESVEVYKEGLAKKYNITGRIHLDDLYVRFLRLAERKIVEQSKHGIICFISNASYLSDASFAVLRERFLSEFSRISVDNLNGDSRESGKLTPEGKPDPSIFSTDRNPSGIRVGTAVGLFLMKKKKPVRTSSEVLWRDFWGESKRANLLASVGKTSDYAKVTPTRQGRWSFRPTLAHAGYSEWMKLTELCEHEPIYGLNENRRGAMINVDRAVLAQRMSVYYDARLPDAAIAAIAGSLMAPAARFDPSATRQKALSRERFDEKNLCRHAWLPMDTRWCFWSPVRPLWNEPRPALREQQWEGNVFLALRRVGRKQSEMFPVYATSGMPDLHIMDPDAVAIPLQWKTPGTAAVTANLSPLARSYLATVGIPDPDRDVPSATSLWHLVLALSYSPAWLAENGPAIRTDFPRVPLPSLKSVFHRGAELGRRLADLLDPDRPVTGVTTGTVRPELRLLGQIRRKDGGAINEAGEDLAVVARWGTLQRASVVMPGPGHKTPSDDPAFAKHPMGADGLHIWLNDHVCIANVPKVVWDFTIGGNQVIKKWLSYRERTVIRRNLSIDEARHCTSMVRRLAEISVMAKDLDNLYQQSKAKSWTPGPESPRQ